MTAPLPPLREQDVDADPLREFERWFELAGSAVPAPEAAALATATPDGAPSVRMVLLKGVDERGFTFYTNYESRKGQELEANPRAAMMFYWAPLGRQVRIEGPVSRTTDRETGDYVRSRARDSQLSALASPQSRPISDRAALDRLFTEVEERYAGVELPLPANWGGFRIAPETIEFWQDGAHRRHDRLRYRRAGNSAARWQLERLAP